MYKNIYRALRQLSQANLGIELIRTPRFIVPNGPDRTDFEPVDYDAPIPAWAARKTERKRAEKEQEMRERKPAA